MNQKTRRFGIAALALLFLACGLALFFVFGGASFAKTETASAYTNTIRYGSDGVKDYNTKHWETGNGGRIKGESSGTMTFGAGDISTSAVSFTAATFDNSGGNYKYSVGGTAHAMFWTFQTSTRLYSGSQTQSMFKWLAEADGSVKLSGLIGKYMVNGSSAVELPWMNINWGSSAFNWYDSATFEISVWRAPVNGTPICIDSQSFSSAFRYDINPSGKSYYVKAGDAMYVCIKLSAWNVSGQSEWNSNCLTLVSAQFTSFVQESGTYEFKDDLSKGVDTHYWSYMTDQNVRGYNQTSGRWNYRAATISAANGYSIKDTFTHTTSGTDNKRFVGSSNTNNIFWAYQVVTSEEKATVFEWTAENTGTVKFSGLAAKTISNKGLLANKTGTKVKALYSNWENSSYAWHNGQSFTLGMYKVATNGTVTVFDEHTYTDEFVWLIPQTQYAVSAGEKIVFAYKCNEDGGSGWNTGAAMIVEADFYDAVATSYQFCKNMILQRDKSVNVYGFGRPGNAVTVSFAGQTKNATVDANGYWITALDAMSANASDRTMTITDGYQTETLTGVRVGEVWLTNGQSNMAYSSIELISDRYGDTYPDPMAMTDAELKETGLADYLNNYDTNVYSNVRLLEIPYNATTSVSQKGVNGTWTNKTYGWAMSGTFQQWMGYSAYALGFAFRLQQKLGIPVGIVNCAVGGSSIEQWLSADTISDNDLSLHYDAAQKAPSRLYNGMMYPIKDFTVGGFLHYQGEADSGINGDSATTQTWVTDWYNDMIALVGQVRSEHGNIPVVSQQLVQNDDWVPWRYIRQKNWDLMSAIDNFYTVSGIGNGINQSAPDTTAASNKIHPIDKYSISRDAANIAMHYVYGDTSCAGIAAYPEKVYKVGSTAVIDYGAGESATGYALTLSTGSFVNNLEAYNGSAWVTVTNATLDGTRIIIPGAASYTKVRYAQYNAMATDATTASTKYTNTSFNSSNVVNLYTTNGVACAPFLEIEIGSGASGVSVIVGEDINMTYTFYIKGEYDNGNPTVYYTYNGHDLSSVATKNANGSYTVRFAGIAPQDMNDGITITKVVGKNSAGTEVDLALGWAKSSNYSVKDYLLELKAADSSEKTQKLVVNMLNYGAAAQTYLGHDIENLVNASISDEDQAAYAVAFNAADVSANVVRSLTGTASDTCKFMSASVYYDSKNGFKLHFLAPKVYEGKVTVTVGGAGSATIPNSKMAYSTYWKDDTLDGYTCVFDNVSITELKSEFTFTINLDGVATGKVLHYNIYANINALSGNDNNNAALLKALYSYGKAVEGYIA